MSVKRMYLVLLAAAIAAGFMLRLANTGTAGFNTSRELGETIGAVVVLFLVAGLAPTVMVLLSRKPIASTASPTALGAIALVAFAYLSYRGSEAERTFARVAFQPPGCTFSASFPGEPERRQLVVIGESAVTQANYYGSDILMRAECFATEVGFAPTREAVMAHLRNYADGNGLMNAEFETLDEKEFVRGLARGWKTVSETPATYEVQLLADGASIMSLVVGGPSSGYPQPGIYEFLTSGRHLGAEAH